MGDEGVDVPDSAFDASVTPQLCKAYRTKALKRFIQGADGKNKPPGSWDDVTFRFPNPVLNKNSPLDPEDFWHCVIVFVPVAPHLFVPHLLRNGKVLCPCCGRWTGVPHGWRQAMRVLTSLTYPILVLSGRYKCEDCPGDVPPLL